MLAERYVAFRRSMGMDEVSEDAEPIKPPAFASDPKDV